MRALIGVVRRRWFGPIVLILVVTVFLVDMGIRVGWVPILPECVEHPDCFPGSGETLISVLGGQRLMVDGSAFSFLQNVRAPWDRSSPPLIYTHNPNLAVFVYYVLGRLGVGEPTPWTIWVGVAAFAAGLWYAWYFVLLSSGSQTFAMIFLLLLATEFHFNLVFGLNALRAWHWVALFGSACHLMRWLLSEGKLGWLHAAMFWTWTFVAFQIGYDFFAVQVCTMISALVVTYLFHRNEWTRRGPVKVIAMIASAVALPVVLRQLQVIRTFGWEFWARDLYFTALIKTAIGNRLVRLSSYEEINAFYRSRHAVRFVAFQSPGTRHTLNVGVSLWKEHWIPYLGWLRWRVSVASFVWAVVIVTIVTIGIFARSRGLGTSLDRLKERVLPRGFRPAVTVVAVVAAQVVGLSVFLPFTIQFWIRYAFPLLISSVELALAFGGYSAIALVACEKKNLSGRRLWAVGLAALAIAAIGGSHIESQIQNYRLARFLPAQASREAQGEILRTLGTFGAATE